MSDVLPNQGVRAEIVSDACMTCGRPWDGHTLPASYTKAWCQSCEAYTRFHANTYVPKSERDALKTALAEIQKIAAREWADTETNYEWYGDIAGIAEEALGIEIGGSDDGGAT
jgi:ribosome-binding protein aMBF1 (putative translation factor)